MEILNHDADDTKPAIRWMKGIVVGKWENHRIVVADPAHFMRTVSRTRTHNTHPSRSNIPVSISFSLKSLRTRCRALIGQSEEESRLTALLLEMLAADKHFGIGRRMILAPPFQKAQARRSTVTNSSEEVVRCCVEVTLCVLSFPTLPDMSAPSKSSRQWPSAHLAAPQSHLQNQCSCLRLHHCEVGRLWRQEASRHEMCSIALRKKCESGETSSSSRTPWTRSDPSAKRFGGWF